MTPPTDLLEPAPAPPATRHRLSYEEFLEWDEENQHVEWVDGEVVYMSPVSREHSDVGLFLARLFSAYAESRGGGQVLQDPFQMKTGPDLPGRAPDIQFIAQRNAGRVKRLYTDGPADLVVEIISPGSRGTDRGDKFYEYEAGGVREYWLIDPDRRQAEFYQLGDDKLYHLTPPDADGVYHAREIPGLWLRVAWLWQSPLPPVLGVLREWKLI